jgi:hypothetical protein
VRIADLREQKRRAILLREGLHETPRAAISALHGWQQKDWPIALVWRVARPQTPAGKAFIALALEYAKTAEAPGLRAA